MRNLESRLLTFVVESVAVIATVFAVGMLVEQQWFRDDASENKAYFLLARGVIAPVLVMSLAVLFIHRRVREAEAERRHLRAQQALRLGTEHVRHVHQKEVQRERLRTEEELRASSQRFRALVENSSDGIALLAADASFLYAGPSTSRVLGYSPDELLGRSAFDLIHPEDLLATKILFRKCVHNPGQPFYTTCRCRHQDGTWRYLEGIGNNRLEDPAVGGIVLNYRDITDRKLVELAVRESEDQYRTVAEAASDAIFTIDEEGRMLFVNRATEAIFGYQRDELLGRPLTMLMPEALREKYLAGLRRYCETGRRTMPWEPVQFPGRHRSGREIPLEISFSECVKEGKRVFVGIVRDISERKKLEERLRQAQKMEAIGQLAGGVAHDFNNLLTAILGYADLMLYHLDPADPLAQHAQEVVKAAERAAALTRQLLAFSRKQLLVPTVLQLDHLVANLDLMLRRVIGEHIEVVTEVDPGLAPVKADAGQIEQVILNLAVNARDAMPQGGRLTIQTANAELDWAYARSHPGVQPGAYVVLTISDTGVGMSEEVQAHLFEPFFTTKESGKGTGLGLSTVYGIVQQSGGHIGVHSQAGQGTTFHIYLPRAEEPVAVSPTWHDLRQSDTLVVSAEELAQLQEESGPASSRPEVILLVEDQEGVRSLVRTILQKDGYAVLEARHGEEALRVCGQCASPIQLLLTDVIMPQMNGPELARRLRPLRPELKVLFISGHPENTAEEGAPFVGEAAFLPKPFTPSQLLRKVHEVLEPSGLPVLDPLPSVLSSW